MKPKVRASVPIMETAVSASEAKKHDIHAMGGLTIDDVANDFARWGWGWDHTKCGLMGERGDELC